MSQFLGRNILWVVTGAAFMAALLLQSVWWWHFDIIDSSIWSRQGRYLMDGNPDVFDFLAAYAHPGGFIIVGTLLLGQIGFSDEVSLRIFLSICGALVIAASALCCYVLRRDYFWVIGAVLVLSLHKLYIYATPTTAVAAPLIALLVLYTLVLYERKVPINAYSIALWGAISGLAVSTRADIGGLASAVFFIPLLLTLRLKESILAVLVSLAVFIITDPFMWFMPLQHLLDLVAKVTMHYSSGEISSYATPVFDLIDMTLLGLVSSSLLAGLLAMKVKILPKEFVYTLATFTIVLFFILLTSEFQTPRYFMPVVLVWEVFLALFMSVAVDQVRFLSSKEMALTKVLIKSALVLSVLLVHLMTLYLRFDFSQPLYPILFP